MVLGEKPAESKSNETFLPHTFFHSGSCGCQTERERVIVQRGKKGGVVKFGAPVISVRRTPRRILQIRRFHRISRYDRRSLHCRHYVTVKHNLGQGRFYVPVPFFSLFYISLFPLLSFVPRFHFLVFFGSGMCCFRFMARSLPGYVCQAGA